MRLKPEQITILQEDLCAELVEILMNEWHYSMQESLSILYNSDTFTLIQDIGTGLYYQNAGYVYTFLEEELKKGKVA
ncbi:MAG: hypothetical protein U0K71_06665 [Paludibacteraceae bacterium]|nr:hypothetical protein [Paludibacteraceae bacterium]